MSVEKPKTMFDQKVTMLQDPKSSLHTKKLVEQLPELLKAYETALLDYSQHRASNNDFVASSGSDCQAVKQKLLELSPPEEKLDPDKPEKPRKMTLADKAAWLNNQRTENRDLITLIARQQSVAFILEGDKTAIEIAKERLANARTVLELKTAQLKFLGGE